MALAMPLEHATQATLAAEGRPLKTSRLASQGLIRQSLGCAPVRNRFHPRQIVQVRLESASIVCLRMLFTRV